jgi:hypothetical protein
MYVYSVLLISIFIVMNIMWLLAYLSIFSPHNFNDLLRPKSKTYQQYFTILPTRTTAKTKTKINNISNQHAQRISFYVGTYTAIQQKFLNMPFSFKKYTKYFSSKCTQSVGANTRRCPTFSMGAGRGRGEETKKSRIKTTLLRTL